MSDSQDLFDKLRSFNTQDSTSKTPEELFLDYCRNFLSAVERLHFDYKEKQDRSYAVLDDGDKRNLAKAVSGFANSGGGVLIWGLRDETLAEMPINDIKEFVSNLVQLSTHVTDPTVPDIDADFILSDKTSSTEGFAIIHIPESPLPPHRVILSNQKIQDRYYFRSGDSFIIASHTLLEDMFGRRPKPNLHLKATIKPYTISTSEVVLDVYIEIFNDGRAIARYPFLSVKIQPPHGIYPHGIDGNGHFGLPRIPAPSQTRSYIERSFGGGSDYVIHSGSSLTVFSIRTNIEFDKGNDDLADMEIEYQLSADGIQPIVGRLTMKGSDIIATAAKLRDEIS